MVHEDVDLDYALRPGIVEGILREENEDFQAKHIETYRDEGEVGKVLKWMRDEEIIQIEDDIKYNKYSISDEIKGSEERSERFGEQMRKAKKKWWNRIEEKTEGYDMEKLEEDIPEGLLIDETNRGRKKLFERRDHLLNDETKEYLAEIKVIRDKDDMEVIADEIDITMLENYFKGQEWNYN